MRIQHVFCIPCYQIAYAWWYYRWSTQWNRRYHMPKFDQWTKNRKQQWPANKQRIHSDSYRYFIVEWPEDYPSIQNRDQLLGTCVCNHMHRVPWQRYARTPQNANEKEAKWSRMEKKNDRQAYAAVRTHTQIPQILHEIIVGSSEMITARLGPYLLACLLHRNFALIRQPNPTNLKRIVLNGICAFVAVCGRRKRERYMQLAVAATITATYNNNCVHGMAWHGNATYKFSTNHTYSLAHQKHLTTIILCSIQWLIYNMETTE